MDKATYGAEKKPETNVQAHTVEDVYEWIDKNIEYGWLGQDGKAHICEMKDFQKTVPDDVCVPDDTAEDRNLH